MLQTLQVETTQLTDLGEQNLGNMPVCGALIDEPNAEHSRHLHYMWHVQLGRGWRQQSRDVDAQQLCSADVHRSTSGIPQWSHTQHELFRCTAGKVK